MVQALFHIFEGLSDAVASNNERVLYSVAPVPGAGNYFVGKDSDGRACLLISVGDSDRKSQAPIRLESLEVQFEVPSIVKTAGRASEGVFTVIRCRAFDIETVRYFYSVCEIILQFLGLTPHRAAIAHVVNRLALIFQKLESPPLRAVNGLFGELFLIGSSRNARHSLSAWRAENSSCYDFTSGDMRLDVKVTNGRIRVHTFSCDQCDPPPGTIAYAASMYVERATAGLTLRALIEKIERRVSSDAELVLKLYDLISATLGTALAEALGIGFDERLARSSLGFFDLRAIPAIRPPLPAGVSDIHFRSDLSALTPVTAAQLGRSHPSFSDFLP